MNYKIINLILLGGVKITNPVKKPELPEWVLPVLIIFGVDIICTVCYLISKLINHLVDKNEDKYFEKQNKKEKDQTIFICLKCGKVHKTDENFCSNCGNKLKNDENIK